MTPADGAVSSRHLLDPELAPLAESFPVLHLSAENLAAVRAALAAPAPGAPNPEELFPDVSTTEKHVPGFEGDPDVRVLHYEPKGRSEPTGALVWIHGGGFVLGRAEVDELLCRQVAAETGAVVVSVDYRLAPETQAPGLVHDCYAALRWVYAHAESLGVDRDRIAVGGMSAGGGLAAAVAVLARDLGEVPVSHQFLVYPMLDDRTGTTTAPHPYAGEFVWTAADNRFGWSAHLGHEPGGDATSPYAAAARVSSVAGLPPAFIAVGALDLFLEEDVAYATRLVREGVPTELHVYRGAFHAFDKASTARVVQSFSRDLITALGRHFDR